MIEEVGPIKIDPTSISNMCTVFDNLHMQWMCVWMGPYNITAPLVDQVFGWSHLELWTAPGQQRMWNAIIEAVDPIKIDPTSMSYSCKVFDNLHMQWMCIWMGPYNITAALVDPVFGSHLEFCLTPWQQKMVKCSDWSCISNQDWSHINLKHMIWMGPYNITAPLVDQAFRSHREFWVTPGQ